MQLTPPFTAAIFDLDGTITASSFLHLQSFNEVLQQYGIQISRETWFRIYEGTGAEHIFEDALAKKGLLNAVNVEELRAKRRLLYKELATRQLLPVKGFGQFYDGLRELRVPSIIATNAEDSTLLLSLQILKLQDEPRVNSEEAGRAKPDPAVYLLACKRLDKQPGECVVFEDSVSGVLAAKRAGCYCVALLTTTPREELEEAGADMVIQDFSKLTPGMLFVTKL
jgi:beta-phosphoglucomutase